MQEGSLYVLCPFALLLHYVVGWYFSWATLFSLAVGSWC